MRADLPCVVGAAGRTVQPLTATLPSHEHRSSASQLGPGRTKRPDESRGRARIARRGFVGGSQRGFIPALRAGGILRRGAGSRTGAPFTHEPPVSPQTRSVASDSSNLASATIVGLATAILIASTAFFCPTQARNAEGRRRRSPRVRRAGITRGFGFRGGAKGVPGAHAQVPPGPPHRYARKTKGRHRTGAKTNPRLRHPGKASPRLSPRPIDDLLPGAE